MPSDICFFCVTLEFSTGHLLYPQLYSDGVMYNGHLLRKVEKDKVMIKSADIAIPEIGKEFAFAPFQSMIQPIIHEVLKEHHKDKFRKGTILTPCVLVWLCLALVLRRNLNYKKTLDWLFSGFRWKFLKFSEHIVKDGTIIVHSR